MKNQIVHIFNMTRKQGKILQKLLRELAQANSVRLDIFLN